MHFEKSCLIRFLLEVGPGKGILTNLLAKKVKRVIAVEIDEKLIKSLKEILPSNVILIKNDVIKLNFENLPKFNKVVSNLPYQISSPFTFKVLDYNFDLAILIYQKEFADRIIAKPGNKKYSKQLGCWIQRSFNLGFLFCFINQPRRLQDYRSVGRHRFR